MSDRKTVTINMAVTVECEIQSLTDGEEGYFSANKTDLVVLKNITIKDKLIPLSALSGDLDPL
jgi:hypothetical protein